jgi:hypothetical protein
MLKVNAKTIMKNEYVTNVHGFNQNQQVLLTKQPIEIE